MNYNKVFLEYFTHSGLAFAGGVLASMWLGNPPAIGGLVTLCVFYVIDRLVAKYQTGDWTGVPIQVREGIEDDLTECEE